MTTRRVANIAGFVTVAVMIGWPSYELLTRQPGGEPVALAVSAFPDTIPLAVRLVGDQTVIAEPEGPVIDLALVAPDPRPAYERPLPQIPAADDFTALGYASTGGDPGFDGPANDPFWQIGTTPVERPVSANPFYVPPVEGDVSSGDYLLDPRYGDAGPGPGGSQVTVNGQPQGYFLDEYLRAGGRPATSRSSVTVRY